MNSKIDSPVSVVLAVSGVVAYLLVGAVPYAVSGLVVPGAALVVLLSLWTAGLGGLFVVVRSKPRLTPLAPVAALVFWLAFVSIGSWLFGWTA